MRNAEFCRAALGLPGAPPALEFDAASVDAVRVDAPSGAYAVIFPGAGRGHRRWPARHFTAIGSHLRERCRMEVVIAGGPADRELGREIQRACPGAIDCSGCSIFPSLLGSSGTRGYSFRTTRWSFTWQLRSGPGSYVVSNGNSLGRFLPYPSDVLAGSEYVFPEGMIPPGLTLEDVVERYCEWSDLDIATVAPERVREAVDRALSAG